MRKIVIVFGTRPEAIKMCPVVIELKKEKTNKVVVAVTGQHREMLDQVLEVFEVVPDYDLNILQKGQTLFDITEKVMEGLKIILEKESPNLVLVHGDTTTSYAAALTAFYMHIPIGHVEAGLRTYNKKSPFPEEFNRSSIGVVSDIHFAPTKTAMDNLIREGRDRNSIFVTGNTAIDALKYTVDNDYRHQELDWASDSRLILITAHRRENIGTPMYNMFKAIKRIINDCPDVKAIYPIHLNPEVRKIAGDVFGEDIQNSKLHIIEPLNVVDFHNFMKACHLILTDSGGIQEEAPSLGKPVLVMRDTTERPEGIEAGTLKLVGTDENTIYDISKKLLTVKQEYEHMAHAVNPYGDGHASERISEVIGELINE